MNTLKIEILNPKATQFLKFLADIKFISIEKSAGKKDLRSVLKKIHSKNYPPMPLDEITKEVEAVRKKRYGK